MNTSIVGRHIKIDDKIKESIYKSADSFKKYHLDIISVSAKISKEERHKKPLITFEFVINIANIDTVVVKQKDQDLHKAIDLASHRVAKILRRHHDKIKSHDATKLTEAFEKNDDEIND